MCRATSSLLSSTCTQRIRFKTPDQLDCQNNSLQEKKKKKEIGFLAQMFFLRYLVVRLANSGRKVPSERKTYTRKRMFCITDNQWSFCKSLKKNVHHSTKLIKFRPKKKKKKRKRPWNYDRVSKCNAPAGEGWR